MATYPEQRPDGSVWERQLRVAWAAGFIDGEGSFTTTTSRKGVGSPFMEVSQLTEAPLLELASLFGGIVRAYNRKGFDCKVFRWQLSGKANLVLAIQEILPHLKNKTGVANNLLEYCYLVGPVGKPITEGARDKRVQLSESIRSMNRRAVREAA